MKYPPKVLEPMRAPDTPELILRVWHPVYPTLAAYVVEGRDTNVYKWYNNHVVTQRYIPENSTKAEIQRETQLMIWEHVSQWLCPLRREWQPKIEEL